MRIAALSTILLVSLTACQKFDTPQKSNMSAGELLALPVTFTYEQVPVTLEAYAWIDAMPGGGLSGKKPLRISITVKPKTVAVTPQKLFIIQNQNVWESSVYRQPSGDYMAELDDKFLGSSLSQTTLNFAVQLSTAQGTQLLRVAGDQKIDFPQ